MTKLCRCGHQDVYHHPRLKYCQHAEGSDVACVCQGFVLVAGSTTPRPAVGMDSVADLTLTPGYQAARAEVMAAEARAEKAEEQLRAYVEAETLDAKITDYRDLEPSTKQAGWDPIEAADRWEDDARKLVAERRRGAVLHPIAQAAAAEKVDVDLESTHGIDIKGEGSFEVENIERAPHPPCYGCGHVWDMHEEGSMGTGLACRVSTPITGPDGYLNGWMRCPCPIYVASPPPDACGRCGHAQNLHRVYDTNPPGFGCVGTGVDEYGHEIARACQCGRMGAYTPEQPAEISPWEKVMLMGVEAGLIDVGRDDADPLCLCGHGEGLHGDLGAPSHRRACMVERDGDYVDGCIDFRPATTTERLANGVIIEHTTRETR